MPANVAADTVDFALPQGCHIGLTGHFCRVDHSAACPSGVAGRMALRRGRATRIGRRFGSLWA
jgi:hypothetical protein